KQKSTRSNACAFASPSLPKIPTMRNNTLLLVTRRDPLDQTIRSMVSQLLELGICFEFDQAQNLPSELPANLADYPALLIDDPMLEDVDTAQLDRYARGGGHVWRLEEV